MPNVAHLARLVPAVLSPVLALVVAAGTLGAGCAINTLGRGPDDLDLKNDGTEEAQTALYRNYEVVYERGTLRRPGADPAAVAADIHVAAVDDVSSPAWSDAAYNYLSGSDDAAAILESPAVAFDEFAHSGNGELVILGVGAGTGLIGGAISWFVPTTVRDGISAAETNQLTLDASAGLFAGLGLGLVVAAAYTYIVPAVTTPMAATQYRAAVRAFNDELDERIAAAAADGEHGDGDCAAGKCPTDHCDAKDGKCCCCDGGKCDMKDGKCCCDGGKCDMNDGKCCCDGGKCDMKDGKCCCCGDARACPAHAEGAEQASPTASPEAPRPVEAPAAAPH